MKQAYSMVKKQHIIVLFILLAIAIIGNYLFFGYFNSKESRYRSEKEDVLTWSQSLVSLLAHDWDASQLTRRSHPMMLANIERSGHDIQQDFEPLRQLGRIKKENCVLVNYAVSENPPERFGVAMVTCNPVYEHGKANMVFELKQEHMKSQWRITNFTFNLLSLDAPPQ